MVYQTQKRPELLSFLGSREVKRKQKERKKQKLELDKVLKAVQKLTMHTNSVKPELEIFNDAWAKLIDRFDAGEVEIKKGVI